MPDHSHWSSLRFSRSWLIGASVVDGCRCELSRNIGRKSAPIHSHNTVWRFMFPDVSCAQAISGERGEHCVPDPVVADSEGEEVIPYTPTANETCIDPESGSEVNESRFIGRMPNQDRRHTSHHRKV